MGDSIGSSHFPGSQLEDLQKEHAEKTARIKELKWQIEGTERLLEKKRMEVPKERIEAFRQLREKYDNLREEYNELLSVSEKKLKG